ncbi:hypothetical protein C1886_18215 [Pseudomonas sp. FW300-N1A1]|nr:hypothetical protein C1886_18215 [Pseudomonas sp. FW300-N1A1]
MPLRHIAVQQRFINLIDVLYDQDKRLILLGERDFRGEGACSRWAVKRPQQACCGLSDKTR